MWPLEVPSHSIFLLFCVKYNWKISAVLPGGDDSVTEGNSISPKESHPATEDVWAVLTLPLSTKEVIHLKCSIKHLLPRFLNKNGCNKSILLGTQMSVGQSKTKMFYNETFFLFISIHKQFPIPPDVYKPTQSHCPPS